MKNYLWIYDFVQPRFSVTKRNNKKQFNNVTKNRIIMEENASK